MRAWTNIDDITVCQLAYFCSCGLCCRSLASRSIGEDFIYDVQYDDRDIDKDLPSSMLKKVFFLVDEANTEEVDVIVAEVVGN